MPAKALPDRSLLLVEDDSALSRLVVSHMEALEWSVAVASSSASALDLIRDTESVYAYAMIDIYLPLEDGTPAEAYVGYQLAEQIAQVSPETRMIGMSQFLPADQGLRSSGRFDAFVEKRELIQNPTGTLGQYLQCDCAREHGEDDGEQALIPRPSGGRALPWPLVAAMCGIGAAAIPPVFVLVGAGVLRASLIVGLAVFTAVLLLNPRRRYFRAFATILGAWLSSTVLPQMGVHVESARGMLSFFRDGPGWMFHVVAMMLMIATLALDWRTRPRVDGHTEEARSRESGA